MAKKDVGPASTPALKAIRDEGLGGLDAHTEQDVVRQMALGTFYVCRLEAGQEQTGDSIPFRMRARRADEDGWPEFVNPIRSWPRMRPAEVAAPIRGMRSESEGAP